jgi:hypothetical protein
MNKLIALAGLLVLIAAMASATDCTTSKVYQPTAYMLKKVVSFNYTNVVVPLSSYYGTTPGTFYYSPMGGYAAFGNGCVNGKAKVTVWRFPVNQQVACMKNSQYSNAAWAYIRDYTGLCE